jgi:hypothetical protein
MIESNDAKIEKCRKSGNSFKSKLKLINVFRKEVSSEAAGMFREAKGTANLRYY